MSESIEVLLHLIDPPDMFYYLKLKGVFPAFLTEHSLVINTRHWILTNEHILYYLLLASE